MSVIKDYNLNNLVVGYAEKRKVQRKQLDLRAWMTIIKCISTIKISMLLVVIYKGKDVQQQWFPSSRHYHNQSTKALLCNAPGNIIKEFGWGINWSQNMHLQTGLWYFQDMQSYVTQVADENLGSSSSSNTNELDNY